jgi:hypothetical protein
MSNIYVCVYIRIRMYVQIKMHISAWCEGNCWSRQRKIERKK